MSWLLSSTALGQQLAICDCSVVLISYLNGNSETCDAKLPKPFNFSFYKRTQVASRREETPDRPAHKILTHRTN
ncbi:hypothetical protein [Nostoc sp. LPT]|uniref:hypothetical protein n=1 Tax=Nostoc sp. LPT TaxID=2815387 RepID=UPI001D3BAED8|nr:hypothetical protein [Nostoc sp. LPT]MBN4003770.1 hypothetical protein [Nostoc sp. LPT]